MRRRTEEPQTINVDEKLIRKIKSAIKVALEYEKKTSGNRKLGITGEVGEILVCYHARKTLGLKLVLNPRSEGFDAIDKNGLRVQIKTRRSESHGLPGDRGRTGSFSKHPFDYALLCLLDSNYQLREVWRADYDKLNPIIKRLKRRNPTLSSFKKKGKPIFGRQSASLKRKENS